MVISLPSDGAIFHLDEQATGPVSSFIAGQSDVPRCDPIRSRPLPPMTCFVGCLCVRVQLT